MLRKIAFNPAVVLYIVNALAAMAVAWGWHASPETLGAVDTIVTGVLTAATAFLVRPVELPTAIGAAATVLTAFSAFHLHIDPNVITTTLAVVSIGLGFVLHAFGVPTIAAKQGKTAREVMLEAPNPGTQ